MSTTLVTIERVNEVQHHPEADRLDVVQVLGYQVITGRDNFKVGDAVVYFPPDILLPIEVAQELGVGQYLKHAVFPGETSKSQCRVSACRLRGLPSHGFLVSVSQFGSSVRGPGDWGRDVTDYFGARKYFPPVRHGAGDAERESFNFPRYTQIEHIQRYPDLIEDGTEVVISEKIHGTNVRMGFILDDAPEGQQWTYAAGSHKVRRKEGPGLYWDLMGSEVRDLLFDLHIQGDGVDPNVVLYGEIFGPGVQDMDYGCGVKSLRVFDIAVDGQYLDYDLVVSLCETYGLQMVPELYRGPFSHELVEKYTYGPTTFEDVRCKFKGREGCAVKPVTETLCRGNRVILKSTSADYRNRKGAIDNE